MDFRDPSILEVSRMRFLDLNTIQRQLRENPTKIVILRIFEQNRMNPLFMPPKVLCSMGI